MLTSAIAIGWLLAQCGTQVHLLQHMDDAAAAAWREGRDGLGRGASALMVFVMFACSIFWPLYWAARATFAVPQLLLPAPQDPV